MLFISSSVKKAKGKERKSVTLKSMMSNGTNERLKIYTQHVPLRQNAEKKVRRKELETVWDDANE
jgi:hypothetical protein